jgi:Ca2+-binding EF-hand superfamily protein
MSFSNRLSLSRVEKKIVAQELENSVPEQQVGDPDLDQESLELLFDRFETGGTVHRKLFPTMVGLMGIRIVPDVLQPLAASAAKLPFANKEEWCNFANQYWAFQRSDILHGVFRRYMDDGEVHITELSNALEFLHIHVDPTWLKDVYEDLTQVNTLDYSEFIRFVNEYWHRSQKEYHEAFRKCDQDMSGAIDMFELSGLLAALDIMPLETVLAEIFAEVDVDGSGEIEFNEFQTFIRILHMREGFTLSEHNRLMATFRKFDLDKSGNLDMDEALKTLVYMHYSISRDEAEVIFKSFTSQHGGLTEREFILFMRKVREKELFQIKTALKELPSITTKEQALVSLLAQFDHFPDLDAVRECAAEAGINTSTEGLTAERAAEVDAKTSLHRRLRASLAAEPESLQMMRRLSAGSTAESRRDTRNSLSMREEQDLLLSMGEAWKFLDVYRSREGLTLARLKDNESAFSFGREAVSSPEREAPPRGSAGSGQDAPDPAGHERRTLPRRSRGSLAMLPQTSADDDENQEEEEEEEEEEIDTRGVRKALLWLGWDLPRSLVLQLIGVVDVDQSGLISLKEFHKLIRMCCERELVTIREANPVLGSKFSSLQARITRADAVRVLQSMGFNSWRQSFALRCLGFQVTYRLAERFTRRAAAEVSLIATTTVYQLVQVVRSLNQEIRDTFRRNECFAPKDVEDLKRVFDGYVEEGGTGRLTGAIQRKLLEDQFPRTTFPELDWKALLPTIPTTDGTIDFVGFLQIKRHAEDLLEKRREKKELDFLAISDFSPSEVHEFRAIFVAQDSSAKDSLCFKDVESLISSIVPMGDKLHRQFRTIYNSVVAGNPRLHSDLCDFTDFLMLMQQLLSQDFADLGLKAPAAGN